MNCCHTQLFSLKYYSKLLSKPELLQKTLSHICLRLRKSRAENNIRNYIENDLFLNANPSHILKCIRDLSIKCPRTKSQHSVVQVQVAYSHKNMGSAC